MHSTNMRMRGRLRYGLWLVRRDNSAAGHAQCEGASGAAGSGLAAAGFFVLAQLVSGIQVASHAPWQPGARAGEMRMHSS